MWKTSFSELLSLNPAQRASVRVIYEEAFPPRQRVPFRELVSSARRHEKLILVMTDSADPVAFAVVSRLESAGCAFVEYFAVIGNRRSRGIGHMLWPEILRALKERGGPLRLVLEVEDPAEPGIAGDEVEVRQRRIRFWEQMGAVLLPDGGYLMPNLDGDGTEPMRLMWADASAVPTAPPSGERLREVIVALYCDGYGLPEDDPLVVRAGKLPLSVPP